MDYINYVKSKVNLYMKERNAICKQLDTEKIAALVVEIAEAWEKGTNVFIFANGGTAATAEHFATDLSTHPFVSEDKQSSTNRNRLKVHCLNTSGSFITGVSNDLGFENIFVEQLVPYESSLLNSLVIAFSHSGNSNNVVRALEYAKNEFAITVCISGNEEGKAKDYSDIWIPISGTSKFPGQTGKNNNCFHVEDMFMSIAHISIGMLKELVQDE